MTGEYDNRADQRDARLATARIEAAEKEAALVQAELAQQQALLEQQASKQQALANTHAERLDRQAQTDQARQQKQAKIHRENTGARQLHLGQEQLALDNSGRETLAQISQEQASDGAQSDQAFDGLKDSRRSAAVNDALSLRQDYAALAGSRHLETAVNRSAQLKNDAVNQAQTAQKRQARWSERQVGHDHYAEKNAQDHVDDTFRNRQTLTKIADQRNLDLANNLRETNPNHALSQAAKEAVENLRHENKVNTHLAEHLNDKASLEKNLAKSDMARARARADDDQANLETRNHRLETIHSLKNIFLQQQNDAPFDSASFLSRTKDTVNAKEALRLQLARDQEQRFKEASLASQSRVTNHDQAQATHQNKYQESVATATLDKAQSSRTNRQAITELEESYRLRRATQEQKTSQKVSVKSSIDRVPAFEPELESLQSNFSDDFLSAQKNIAGRVQAHHLAQAQHDLTADLNSQIQHGERNLGYAQTKTNNAAQAQSDQEADRLAKAQDFLSGKKTLAKMSEEKQGAIALHESAMEREDLARNSDNARLNQSHHEQQTTSQEARAAETASALSAQLLEDKAAIAKSAHANELNHAIRSTVLETQYRNAESSILNDSEKTRDIIQQEQSHFNDNALFSEAQTLLAHRRGTANQSLNNELRHAQASQVLTEQKINHEGSLVQALSAAGNSNTAWVVDDKLEKTAARNQEGHAVFVRHARATEQALREEAASEFKHEIKARQAANSINQDYAQAAFGNHEYETAEHDHAALTLHQSQAVNLKAKAKEAHDALLNKANDLETHEREVRHWEAERLLEKTELLARHAQASEHSNDEVVLTQSNERLSSHASHASEVLAAQLTSAHDQLYVDRNLTMKSAMSTERIANKGAQLSQEQAAARDHHAITGVLNERDISKLRTTQSDLHVRSEKLNLEKLINRYEVRVASLKSELTASSRLRESDFEILQENFLMARAAKGMERKAERGLRNIQYRALSASIEEKENTIREKGYEGNSLIWWWNNGSFRVEQWGLAIADTLDSVKESFANLSLGFSQRVSSAYDRYVNAVQVAGYGASRVGLWFAYYKDIALFSLEASFESLGDAWTRARLRTSAFVSERFSRFFSAVSFGAKHAGQTIDATLAPIVPEVAAGLEQAGVSAEYAGNRFTAGISKPIRAFISQAKAVFWSVSYGALSFVLSGFNRAKSGIKQVINGLWEGVSAIGVVARNSLSTFGNAARDLWRNLIHGTGQAQREARHKIVLPTKQAVAGADKSRKRGLAYVTSRPAAWWRTFKHEISQLSWRASAATYPAREALSGVGEDSARSLKYYASEAFNGIVYRAQAFFAQGWFGLRAGANAAAHATDQASLLVKGLGDKTQETLPNPKNVIVNAAFTVEAAANDLAVPLALAGNTIKSSTASAAENMAHAAERPTRPVHEGGRQVITQTGHASNQAGDGLRTAGQITVNAASRAGALVGGVVAGITSELSHAGQTLVSSAQTAGEVLGQVWNQTVSQPLDRLGNRISISLGSFNQDFVFRAGRAAQGTGEIIQAGLGLPGQAFQFSSLVLANTADQFGPSFSFGLSRSVLTLRYYGQVTSDGLVYTLEVVSDLLQAPITWVSQGAEASSDAVITGAQQAAQQFDLLLHGLTSSVNHQSAGLAFVWNQSAQTLSYRVAETASAGFHAGHEVGVGLLDAAEQTVPVVSYHAGNALASTGNALTQGGHFMADTLTQGAVISLAGLSTVIIHQAYGVTAVANALGDRLGRANQSRAYGLGQAGNTLTHFFDNGSDQAQHVSILVKNQAEQLFTGLISHAQQLGQIVGANGQYVLSTGNIPLIHGRMIWNDYIQRMRTLGNFCVFELIQTSDKAISALSDGAEQIKDETYYAFEGCGDTIVLRLKGTQVSVATGAGQYKVGALIGLGTVIHEIEKTKDQLHYGSQAVIHEAADAVQDLGLAVVASLGQTKDKLVDPAFKLVNKVLSSGESAAEQARYSLLTAGTEGAYQVQSGSLLLRSAATRRFTGVKHATEEAGRVVSAALGKAKDNLSEAVDNELNIDKIGAKI